MEFNWSIFWSATGVIFAILSAVVFNLIWTIKWMTRIETTQSIMLETLKSMETRLIRHEASFYSKEEAAKDLAFRDQQIKALWSRLDSCNCPNGFNHANNGK